MMNVLVSKTLQIFMILLVSGILHTSSGNENSLYLPIDSWYTPEGSPGGFLGPQWEWALKYGLNQSLVLSEALEDFEIELEFFDTALSSAVAIDLLIDHFSKGARLTGGNSLSSVSASTGQAAAVYGVAQVSGSANTAALSDKVKYPFFSRVCAPGTVLVSSFAFTIQDFFFKYGRGWDQISLLSTSDDYGTAISQAFINAVNELNTISIKTYQQFLPDQSDFSVELREIKNGGARVIMLYAVADLNTYASLFISANETGLIGDEYAWFVGPGIVAVNFYTNPDGTFNSTLTELLRGCVGALVYFPRTGVNYNILEDAWQSDPPVVGGAGSESTVGIFTGLYYDHGFLLGLMVEQAKEQGLFNDNDPLTPTAQQWFDISRNQTFEGSTGRVSLNEDGDRITDVSIVNFISERGVWEQVGVWNATSTETTFFTDIIWNDNTTDIPDLDVRPPIDYWSCSLKESGRDETGKVIVLETPDGEKQIDDIDIEYHCDYFIDCYNLSDESSADCATNYTILFIVFGIITGILMLIACLLIPFVIIFGFIVPRKRVRSSSPLFLLVIIFSCILGYISTFAWYGQPHPVACGFQPWLLGLAVVSMVSALCAKTWRIWRVFHKRFSRVVISDVQLAVFYFIMIIPAFVILVLWTIISTPTARINNVDEKNHYVCDTGGFTGPPGGLVFFFILVGYEGIVLAFGAFLSFVTRKVPVFFNESKLIAVSIYNLVFLSIVCIPVYLVLSGLNPFGAWIIRTCSILYAFTATLWLQFFPKIIGVVVIDKFKDTTFNPKTLRGNNGTTTSSQSEIVSDQTL